LTILQKTISQRNIQGKKPKREKNYVKGAFDGAQKAIA
jgi:hypothetical protein